MIATAPLLVFLGVAGAVALAFVAFWDRLLRSLSRITTPYQRLLERGGIPIKAEELTIGIVLSSVALWAVLILVLKPGPLLGVAYIAGCFGVSVFGTRAYVNRRVKKRMAAFNDQLEMVLRLISSALKVGLGLRQALVTVVADMADPARIEFSRVLTQTQIGVSIFDALDQLAERMPSAEMQMLTRAIRLQGQTGGNLTRVLENLAETIKQRRRLKRKIKAITSESVGTKYIITALPVFVGTFILIFEPDMRAGLLGTLLGRLCLCTVVFLLSVGWIAFDKMSVVDS